MLKMKISYFFTFLKLQIHATFSNWNYMKSVAKMKLKINNNSCHSWLKNSVCELQKYAIIKPPQKI